MGRHRDYKERRPLGRPPAGASKQVQVRLKPEMLDDLDAYRLSQPVRIGRPRAIRQILSRFFERT